MYMLEKVTSKAGMFLDIEIPLQKLRDSNDLPLL